MLPTLCVLLCLGGPATQDASPAPAPLDPAAAHVVAAQEAYAGGRLGDAHDHLRAALELAPGEPGVRLWTGRVLNDLGHGAEALEVLAPALADAPRSAWLLVERARAERGLQRFDDAEADLRAALDAYPTLDAARLELVDVLCERGAARAADALVELAPLRCAGAEAPALVLREARALTLLARDDEAEALLRAAGAEPTVRLALCRHLAERHRPLDAWEVGAPLVEELADVEARTLLAQVARRAGEPLVALRLLGAVLLEDPTHATALAELGEVLEEAPRVLAEVTARRLAARPDDPDAWLELLEGCAREARFEDLLARCTELPAALRDDARVALLRGQALRRLGRADEARALLAPLAERGGARASSRSACSTTRPRTSRAPPPRSRAAPPKPGPPTRTSTAASASTAWGATRRPRTRTARRSRRAPTSPRPGCSSGTTSACAWRGRPRLARPTAST
ncbi:MAG: tetratricopeptide repeat protein [Planctomycetes bacterium]|nr:tetratricopeptide repeat protein [Planctomycetota bacterium]